MTTVAELATKVRTALSVSQDYESITITNGIRRTMKRLLRDYNFGKSIKRATLDTSVGQIEYTLPPGMKRPLHLRFFNPADNTWSYGLERREGFTFGATGSDTSYDGRPYGQHYWIEGTKLFIDTPMPAAGLKLVFWYQSTLLDLDTETWLLDDYEDLIFSRSTMILATELRKPEVMQAFAPLVSDEMQSIAIFLNELEWNGVEMLMREPRALPSARYPTGA